MRKKSSRVFFRKLSRKLSAIVVALFHLSPLHTREYLPFKKATKKPIHLQSKESTEHSQVLSLQSRMSEFDETSSTRMSSAKVFRPDLKANGSKLFPAYTRASSQKRPNQLRQPPFSCLFPSHFGWLYNLVDKVQIAFHISCHLSS